MERRTLGRNGPAVSALGLGAGGASRLGISAGKRPADAIALIRRALDLGVTLFDTSGAIGAMDAILAEGLGARRRDVVLSTKITVAPAPAPFHESRFAARVAAKTAQRLNFVCGPKQARDAVERRLRALRTDHIDLLWLHAIGPAQIERVLERMAPALLALKADGKIGRIGVSEAFSRDPGHAMAPRAIASGAFDALMVGFNILNPSARARVAPLARKAGTGLIAMFAVREGLRDAARLQKRLDALRISGRIRAEDADARALLAFLNEHGAASLTEAAYRFAAHEPGVAAALTGTGDPAHLEANVAAVRAGPLPQPVMDRLASLFGEVDEISGD